LIKKSTGEQTRKSIKEATFSKPKTPTDIHFPLKKTAQYIFIRSLLKTSNTFK
jgi:hypothetical protein